MSTLVPFDPKSIVQQAADMVEIVLSIRERVLKSDVDYGAITDGGKPTLLKPGAEKLANAFKLAPRFNTLSVVEDWSTGVFFYRYECVLVHRETGEIWGSGIGSCSTQEEKYGYRWMSGDRVPSHIDKSTLPMRGGSLTEFEFAIDKAETSGKYGKSAEYWQAFKDAMSNGTAIKGEKKTARGMSVTWSIGGNEYRVPNVNVFDTVNTVDKMAQKRALVAAVLVATNASAHFTQDIEDFDTDKGNVLTGRSAPMVKAPVSPSVSDDEKLFWDALKGQFNLRMNNQNAETAIAAMRGLYKSKSIDASMPIEDVFNRVIQSAFTADELLDDEVALSYAERMGR